MKNTVRIETSSGVSIETRIGQLKRDIEQLKQTNPQAWIDDFARQAIKNIADHSYVISVA